jgi:hypothetical protein
MSLNKPWYIFYVNSRVRKYVQTPISTEVLAKSMSEVRQVQHERKSEYIQHNYRSPLSKGSYHELCKSSTICIRCTQFELVKQASIALKGYRKCNASGVV